MALSVARAKKLAPVTSAAASVSPVTTGKTPSPPAQPYVDENMKPAPPVVVKTDEDGGGTTQPVLGPNTTPAPPKDVAVNTTTRTATGNYESDILGYLRSAFPGARPQDLIAAMPEIQRLYPGTTLVGDDKIRLPNGQVIDVGLSFGAGGGKGWWWGVDTGGPAASAPVSSIPAVSQPTYLQPLTSQTVAGTLAAKGAAQETPLQAAARERLLGLLNRKPPSAEELAAGPESAAYRLGAQRNAERETADLAERASYEGWSGPQSGAYQTGLAGINQRRGEGEAGFLGSLMTQRIESERQDLQFAIQIAMSQGQFDQAQQLQRELADLDAILRREQLGFNYDALQLGANERAASAALDY